MVTRNDYEQDAVEAARSVMLEVFRALGAYREHLVLVGGWVPDLLFPDGKPPHSGSLDIDLAINHKTLLNTEYKPIHDLLIERGFERHEDQLFRYRRTIKTKLRDVVVDLDLLAGEYGGTGRNRRTQQTPGARPRKARGCDIAFDDPVEIRIGGTLPNGAKDSVVIKVASVAAFLVMKGTALVDRHKEKDAYDVYFCIKNHGVEALAEKFRPIAKHGLVREGLNNIWEKFKTTDAFGPVAVADFQGITDPDEREVLQRDAHEQVAALMRMIGIAEAAG